MNQNQRLLDFYPSATPLEYSPKSIQTQMFKFEGMAPEKMFILPPFSNDVSLLSNLSMNNFKDVQSRGSREAEHIRNEELPTRSTLSYLKCGDERKKATAKPYFNAVVNAINTHIVENKYRLLEVKVTRTIKEELKESDLVIEKEIDGEAPQMMYPVRNSSLSYPNCQTYPLKNEPINIERVQELLKQKFELESQAEKNPSQKACKPQRKTIKKPKRIKEGSNVPDSKLARNFPKIFGQTVIRFIKDDLFSDTFMMHAIYDQYDLNDSIQEFKDWVSCLNSQYTTLPFFRRVWSSNFRDQRDKRFAEILKEFTRLFLHREAYAYLIGNSGKKFRNHEVLKEYLKCVPIFLQGICSPESFHGLKSRNGRSF